MTRKISIGVALIIVLAAIVITFQVTFVYLDNKYSRALDDMGTSMSMYQKLAQVDAVYRTGYIGELDDEQLMDGVVAGYILGTGDKYAYYLNKENYAEMMTDSSGEMVGIGVRISYDGATMRVVRVMEGSPAYSAGILKDDLIEKVDGAAIEEIGYEEALERVRGNVDTAVTLTLERDGESFECVVIRKKFDEETVISRLLDSNPTVGIIKIIQFDNKTAEQFAAACEKLSSEGAEKFIFDVRGNPGGNLTAICDVLDYLLPEGPIMHTEDVKGNRESFYSEAGEFDAPMCVLVNGNTASAGELFAAALQDYEKAELVGTATFGKGTAQSVVSLPDGSGFAYSQSIYYPPFSEMYEGVGIIPDHVVEMDEAVASISLYDITDAEDNQLQYAIALVGGRE